MAKELPYFKFEPSEWENGNIQMCSKESKGLFIDICSMYWSRLGEMPYALALQKHCNGSKDALQELENNKIIRVEDSQIIIEFLDEQLDEFQKTSEKRRKAANKRWSDASALQVDSKSNAIKEEKIKEEKIKEESTQSEIEVEPTFDQFYELYDKKVDKDLAEKAWKKVSQKNHELIMEYIPLYKEAEPDKGFRRNPSVFLNKKTWKNEIITKSKISSIVKDGLTAGGTKQRIRQYHDNG